MIYDLAIIGAGPGGANAAEYASKNGLRVILFEGGNGGGTCLNEGCIPSKAYLHTAHLYETIKQAKEHAIEIDGEVRARMDWLQARKKHFVESFSEGISEGFREMGITVVEAYASLTQRDEGGLFYLMAGEQKGPYQARHVIVASGSENHVPSLPGIESCSYISSREALMLESLPKSINILGGGTIAVEMASFFAGMGVEVHLIQRSSRLLKDLDHELSDAAAEQLKELGVHLFLGTEMVSIQGHKIRFRQQEQEICVDAESTLIAMGRRPRTDGVGLNRLGIELKKGAVQVNDKMQTSVPNLYAVGDVVGKSLLAHSARREGQVAVNNILGISDSMRYDSVPSVVYGDPELASVGLSEDEVKEKNLKTKVFRVPMSYAGRQEIEYGSKPGFCKIIARASDGVIVGAQIYACLASEYITPLAMAVDLGLNVNRLSQIAFPHPSMAEIVHHAIFPNEWIK